MQHRWQVCIWSGCSSQPAYLVLEEAHIRADGSRAACPPSFVMNQHQVHYSAVFTAANRVLLSAAAWRNISRSLHGVCREPAVKHITFPEALQVLYDLQRVAGVLAAHKGQHCNRFCCARLYGWRLPRDAGGLQQTSALLQQPAERVTSFCTAFTTSSQPADTDTEPVDTAGG